jgi:hypothetical protein
VANWRQEAGNGENYLKGGNRFIVDCGYPLQVRFALSTWLERWKTRKILRDWSHQSAKSHRCVQILTISTTMVSHHYLSTPLDQSDRKEGRGKIVPVGLLFCLFAFAVWQVRHALPSYLYAMSVDNGRFDGDNSINITTIDPTHLRLQSKGKASVELTETEEEPHHDETVNNLRRDFKMNCTHNDTASMGDNDLQEELQRILTPIFTPPSELPKLEENDPVKPCRYTFLDLGANVGK